MPLILERPGRELPADGHEQVPEPDYVDIHDALADTHSFLSLTIPPARAGAVEIGMGLLFNNWSTGRIDLDMVEVDLDVAEPLLRGAGIPVSELLEYNPLYQATEHDPETAVILALIRYWTGRIREARRRVERTQNAAKKAA